MKNTLKNIIVAGSILAGSLLGTGIAYGGEKKQINNEGCKINYSLVAEDISHIKDTAGLITHSEGIDIRNEIWDSVGNIYKEFPCLEKKLKSSTFFA